MALYEMVNKTSLSKIGATTWKAVGVDERAHLQRALLHDISPLGADLLVIAEEFGEFEGANRRIDLLCIDQTGRLVVVELKRTEDGGHMELQALRYAAMVSTMTLDDVERTLRTHLKKHGKDPAEAEQILDEHLTDVDADTPFPSRNVRIVLASLDFSTEITTTVLWLNELSELDIECVRITPYQVPGLEQLVLDVQRIIPLPEADAYTVNLKRKEQAVKAASLSSRDLTKYRIVRADGSKSEPQAKRQALRLMVEGLHHEGVPAETISAAVNGRLQPVEGTLRGDPLAEAFAEAYPTADLGRWFLESPLHDAGKTWVFYKMWGTNTEGTLSKLAALSHGIDFEAVPQT